MAPSEVRGGDAGRSNRDKCGCDPEETSSRARESPVREKAGYGSPSPRGSDHSLSRAGARGAARSCLAPAPTTSPERSPPAPGRYGARRTSPSGEVPPPLGSSPLHHRGELGAFSSASGPPCFSLRPRQRCDWRRCPSEMPVPVSSRHRPRRQEPPRDLR
ncbi:unnamed protein product [Pipistrellus nathusii]|uniref:Uncharacterized protein n=1 Tax=Pipistrellus nathusii TaxID=59473 RepID=A0ABN9ZSQ0_PIPNA